MKLSEYWDTMGWIKFQQSKMEDGEKYLFAAWQLADDLTIGMHLGRLYETQGRKNDAIEMYLAALQKAPPNVSLSDDAKETRRRLADILGGYSQVDDRLAQARNKKSSLRTVGIANPGGAQGIAQYTVIIDANSKVVDLAATSPDDPLATLNDAVRAERQSRRHDARSQTPGIGYRAPNGKKIIKEGDVDKDRAEIPDDLKLLRNIQNVLRRIRLRGYAGIGHSDCVAKAAKVRWRASDRSRIRVQI